MNKTVNINLGGMFFHIDEDAYQKLNRYFDAVKRSLSNSTGKDEIMKDIEMRIAELLTEKNRGDKQVVGIKDVEEVITVMGQPEDYRIDDEGFSSGQPAYTYSSNTRRSKKLYRDKDSGMIGGVLAGFGHYLGIDALWLRILMVILFFGFGTGLLVYVILWILIPKAVTTTEKLEMTGEPVNISNIEKKVREEFESISEKFKNADYDRFGRQAKSSAERIGNTLSDIFLRIFSLIGKVIGALLVVFAAANLVSLLIFVITTGSIMLGDFPWTNYVENFTEVPLWIVGLLALGAIGIPFFFLLILGLKLLITNMKSIGNVAKYTLLGLWILSVGILIALGIQQATQFSFDNKVEIRENLFLKEKDTLFLKFKNDDFYSKSIYNHSDFLFTQDQAGRNIIYSNNVQINLLNTDEKTPFLQIEKTAQGKSTAEARLRAEKIEYGYKIEGNKIIFNNFFISEVATKYRNQEVKIFLHLPENLILAPDKSVSRYVRNYHSNLWLHHSDDDDLFYQVEKNELKCLNCPVEMEDAAEENDGSMESDSSETTTVTINESGVQIREGKSVQSRKRVKGLEINDEGVIIKTN